MIIVIMDVHTRKIDESVMSMEWERANRTPEMNFGIAVNLKKIEGMIIAMMIDMSKELVLPITSQPCSLRS